MTGPGAGAGAGAGASSLDSNLFPSGIPQSEKELDRLFELYKIMVASSEALVARRQGLNTFFLTVNGAIVTVAGLILTNGRDARLQAIAMLALTLAGAILAVAWRSLIVSFGQLNTGKFVVINRIEQLFPAAIFLAEWKAIGEGQQPKKYRTFTSREVWTPGAFLIIYGIASAVEVSIATGLLVLP